jgi:hypothetical protein
MLRLASTRVGVPRQNPYSSELFGRAKPQHFVTFAG